MNAKDPWTVRQEIARRLGETYPMWRVWITERTWWATCRTPLPDGAGRAELYATVSADSAEQLKACLDEQTRRWERFARQRRPTVR